ncbi:TPA: hypothetical protein ACS72K_003012 [Providencia alcalifaciens]
MMKTLKIEKYIGDNLDEEINVPVIFISMLNGILPNQALESLKGKNFDFKGIVDVAKNNGYYQSESMIEENGMFKRVKISIN